MHRNGFSLVEMVVVVALIAVIAAMSVVLIKNSQTSTNFQQDKTNLMALLNQARNTSYSQDICSQVQFSGASISLSKFSQADCSLPPGGLTLLQTITLSNQSSLVNLPAGGTIIFNQHGGTIDPSPSTFTLKGSSGETAKFTIFPAIGQINVQ